MSKIVLNSLLALGLLIAVFGAVLDFVLPGASPGLNLPQVLIIVAGLALSFVAWQLRHPRLRRQLSRALGRSMLAALAICGITLVALEIILTVFGMPTYYFATPPEIQVTPIDWWVCDAPGCHYIYENVRSACLGGAVPERICAINRQGYAGPQDFIPPEAHDDRPRLLLLGDSFAFGRSADLGKSYAEFLAKAFPEALIWNTGMSGTGTNQAVEAFRYFAPQLKPQLALLGFYMNDFNDNLLPIDSWFRVLDSQNRPVSARFHFYDAWGNVFKSDIDTAMRYFGHNVGPPQNRLEHAVGITRLGTLLLRLRDSAATLSGSLAAKQIEATGEYVAALRDLAEAHDTDLLVLVIPRQADVDAPSDQFRAALQLMEEARLPYIDPSPMLDAIADYAGGGDGHWNNAGHQKIGALLQGCLESYWAAGRWGDCEHLVLPTGRD